MNPKWSDTYSVGDSKIDHNHKEVFELVSMLDSAIRNDSSEEAVGEIVDFLNHYVEDHFSEEEAYMKTICYAHIDEHSREHRYLRLLVHELSEHFKSNASITHSIFQIRRFIDRLILHIILIDTRLAEATPKGPMS